MSEEEKIQVRNITYLVTCHKILDTLGPHFPELNNIFTIFTARAYSMMGGYVFTGVCLFNFRGGRGYPNSIPYFHWSYVLKSGCDTGRTHLYTIQPGTIEHQ